MSERAEKKERNKEEKVMEGLPPHCFRCEFVGVSRSFKSFFVKKQVSGMRVEVRSAFS